VKGRSRTLNSCVGRLFITQKPANRLGVEAYSRRSPMLEKCCFLLSASESYQNASVDLATLTGVYVSHSSQDRLVERQEFPVPEASRAIAQVRIDGGKVGLRTERGLPWRWRDYKAVRLQDLYYGAFFQDNLSLTDWMNSQSLTNPVIC
jgi:hypothetical protein